MIKQRAADKKGFTLVELIMTIVVVTIISIPLSLMIGQHMRSVFQSADQTMAANLASFEMERVKNLSYANIVNGNFANYQGYDFTVTRAVTLAQGSAVTPESLKQVRVDVQRTGSAVILYTLFTYVANNVGYGP